MALPASQLAQTGYTVVPSLIEPEEVDAIAQCVRRVLARRARTRRLLYEPWCRELAERLLVNDLLSEVLMHDAEAVQCTLFAKTIEKN